MGDLTLTRRRLGGVSVIVVGGELDLMTAGQLEDFVRRSRRPGDQVVLDLTGTAFMDCSGLSALLRVRREAGRDGGMVRLATPRRIPALVLRLTGTDRLLPVYASLDQALAVAVSTRRAASAALGRTCRPRIRGRRAGRRRLD
ncbi:STAS domain-containing protein [Actinoallomurus acanthiterrae]